VTSAVLVPDGPEAGLAWHYGDPFGEQRCMESGGGAVRLWTFRDDVALVWLGRDVPVPANCLAVQPSPVAGGSEVVVPVERAAEVLAGAEPVGLWAYHALRVAAGFPGMARLQLDGSAGDDLPPLEADVLWQGRLVGHLASAAWHHEFGPIALAELDPDVPEGAALEVCGVAAVVG
jgi:hypothetical protein